MSTVTANPAYFDTHTHFDLSVFNKQPLNRANLAAQAKLAGVDRILIAGTTADRWPSIIQLQQQLNNLAYASPNDYPLIHIALGLHPMFIQAHQQQHLSYLEALLQSNRCIAVGEIGLDGFSTELKASIKSQKAFFGAQIQLAMQHHKPVILHIRKNFADTLSILQSERFNQGGIAHAYGGGAQEAKLLVAMGFKLGIGGALTQPNPRKLREVINTVGIQHIVLETDSPDMMPLPCRIGNGAAATVNVPANITVIFDTLCQIISVDTKDAKSNLAKTLYSNSLSALKI